MLTTEDKAKIIKEHGGSEKNVGSTATQVALLTARINDLTEHLQANKKDLHSERGLVLMVGKRRRLLGYLERQDAKAYQELIKKLKLRK